MKNYHVDALYLSEFGGKEQAYTKWDDSFIKINDK